MRVTVTAKATQVGVCGCVLCISSSINNTCSSSAAVGGGGDSGTNGLSDVMLVPSMPLASASYIALVCREQSKAVMRLWRDAVTE